MKRENIEGSGLSGRSGTLSILKDKTAITLFLTAAIALILGFSRYEGNITGMSECSFWAMKTTWRNCADIVVSGDSRINVGISPAEMNRVQSGARIYNFGFNGAGYSETYLKATESLLDPESTGKIIVLGIDPLSLTRKAEESNMFLDYSRKPEKERLLICYAGSVMHFFRPLTIPYIIRRKIQEVEPECVSIIHYHPDGWSERYNSPEIPIDIQKRYGEVYGPDMYGPVIPGIIDRLMKKTAAWSGAGITVYGFRTPTCNEILEIEKAMSGFDEKGFVERFKRAGGSWLDIDDIEYHFFDGNHLHPDSARAFSRKLAGEISGYSDNPGSQ